MPHTRFSLSAAMLVGSLLAVGCATTPSAVADMSDRDRVLAALGDKAQDVAVSDVESNGRIIRFTATNAADERFSCQMKNRVVLKRENAPQDLGFYTATHDIYRCNPVREREADDA